MTGRCLWFDSKKGFGFLEDSETKQQIFFHFSETRDLIKKDDKVIFELDQDRTGRAMAINIKRIRTTTNE